MFAATDRSHSGEPSLSVAWTRGAHCGLLASWISPEAQRVQGDLVQHCVDLRVDLLVTRRLSSFDMVDVAVPHELDEERIASVVAAVSSGPHSLMAARLAALLGEALDVPAGMVSGYGSDADRLAAQSTIDAIGRLVPDLEGGPVEAGSARELVARIPDDALLVLGAPGGSPLHRRLFGPGARLVARAPVGAVVVRRAPPRAFRHLIEPRFVSPHLHAGEAARLVEDAAVPVVDHGRLVGVVRRAALRRAADGATVGDVMGVPRSVGIADPVDAAIDISAGLGGAPVPVIDEEGALVGLLDPVALRLRLAEDDEETPAD